MKLYFIRHLKTKGNYEKRYIGRTDESLYDIRNQKQLRDLPQIGTVFTSPMKRCRETAAIYYPHKNPILVDGLREIDFGEFENKCYEELKENPDYVNFIDSNGSGIIPGGENTVDFKKRCWEAFLEIVEILKNSKEQVAIIVCHGGTIMSIMEQFEEGHKSFYDYQVKNGSGYETELNIETNKIKIIKELIS